MEDREANLHHAVAAFQEALIYHTLATAPLEYAQTQWTMGDVRLDQGDLPAAITSWRETEKYWRLMGQTDWADWMQEQITRAEQGDTSAGG